MGRVKNVDKFSPGSAFKVFLLTRTAQTTVSDMMNANLSVKSFPAISIALAISPPVDPTLLYLPETRKLNFVDKIQHTCNSSK